MEKGKVLDIGDCSYYMMEEYASRHKPRNDKAKALYNYIDKKYSTSVWFRRWFDEGGFKNLSFALRQLNRTKKLHLLHHYVIAMDNLFLLVKILI